MISNLRLNNLTNKVTIIDNKETILEDKFNKVILEYQERLINIENNILKLDDKLKTIDDKLDILVNLINQDIKTDCKKMSEHIDFIESIYENMKAPMDYICSKFNRLMVLENN
jgi:uncharacterized phage infection (PIP) family protein YhgE